MGMIIINGEEYASAPKDGFPPIIYSDEEREIGVWRDGKPLYQKTVDCGALPNNTTKNVNHNISNIDFIVKAEGYALAPGVNSIPIPFTNDTNSTSQLALITTTSVISLRTGIDRSAYTKTYVTLYYTKTTDIAGSGKYTTYGGIAHHYSTSEQVIGTWIDGKPLYEKTIYIDSIPSDTNWHTIAHNISNLKRVINAFAIGVSSTAGTFFNMPNYRPGVMQGISIAINSTNVQYMNDWQDTATDGYITIQYTKTTD